MIAFPWNCHQSSDNGANGPVNVAELRHPRLPPPPPCARGCEARDTQPSTPARVARAHSTDCPVARFHHHGTIGDGSKRRTAFRLVASTAAPRDLSRHQGVGVGNGSTPSTVDHFIGTSDRLVAVPRTRTSRDRVESPPHPQSHHHHTQDSDLKTNASQHASLGSSSNHHHTRTCRGERNLTNRATITTHSTAPRSHA